LGHATEGRRTQRRAAFVDELDLAVDELHFRGCREDAQRAAQPVRHRDVIAGHHHEDLAGRLGHGSVHRGEDALVALMEDGLDPSAGGFLAGQDFLDDRPRAIRGSVVDDDELVVIQVLPERRKQRGLDEGLVVIGKQQE